MSLSKFCTQYNIPFGNQDEFNTAILLGTLAKRDDTSIQTKLSHKKLFALSPIEDDITLQANSFIKYEAGTEEGVLALLLWALNSCKDEKIKEFLANLDIGYLSAESNFGEEEAHLIAEQLKNQKISLFIGKDLEFHPKANNLAKFLGVLHFCCNVHIVLIGQEKNTLDNYELVLPENVEELKSFDGTIVYRCPTLLETEDNLLLGSKQFALSARIEDNTQVHIQTQTGTYTRMFTLDDTLKGTIALLPMAEKKQLYRFEVSKIMRVG